MTKKQSYLIALFTHYNIHYYCNVCQSCILQTANMYRTILNCKYSGRAISTSLASIRDYNSIRKDVLIKRGFKDILLWLGLIDFTSFTNIYKEHL